MNLEIRTYQDSDLESLNQLLKEVYQLEKTGKKNSSNIEFVAIVDSKVVGYTVFQELYDSVRDINYCYVNYVCVSKLYRNRGIATKIFYEIFKLCKEKNISYIELTSNQTRIEAHYLYKNLGFEIRETDVFRKVFE